MQPGYVFTIPVKIVTVWLNFTVTTICLFFTCIKSKPQLYYHCLLVWEIYDNFTTYFCTIKWYGLWPMLCYLSESVCKNNFRIGHFINNIFLSLACLTQNKLGLSRTVHLLSSATTTANISLGHWTIASKSFWGWKPFTWNYTPGN